VITPKSAAHLQSPHCTPRSGYPIHADFVPKTGLLPSFRGHLLNGYANVLRKESIDVLFSSLRSVLRTRIVREMALAIRLDKREPRLFPVAN